MQACEDNGADLGLDDVQLHVPPSTSTSSARLFDLFGPELRATTLSLSTLFFVMALLHLSLTVLTGMWIMNKNSFLLTTLSCPRADGCATDGPLCVVIVPVL